MGILGSSEVYGTVCDVGQGMNIAERKIRILLGNNYVNKWSDLNKIGIVISHRI